MKKKPTKVMMFLIKTDEFNLKIYEMIKNVHVYVLRF